MYATVVVVARAFRHALMPVDWWMSPRYRYGRPPAAVVRWARVRTAGSIVVTVAAGTAYPSVQALYNLIARPLTNFFLAVPAVVAAGLVLLVATPRAHRAAMARKQARLAGRALPIAAGWTLWLVAANGMTAPRPFFDLNPLLALAAWVVVNGLVALIVVPVTLYASYLALRHWFAGADVHPMLPALCVAAFGVAQLVRLAVEGLDPGRPLWLGLLLGVGGPLVLVGLAAVELRLIRRSGVSLRTLPTPR